MSLGCAGGRPGQHFKYTTKVAALGLNFSKDQEVQGEASLLLKARVSVWVRLTCLGVDPETVQSGGYPLRIFHGSILFNFTVLAGRGVPFPINAKLTPSQLF